MLQKRLTIEYISNNKRYKNRKIWRDKMCKALEQSHQILAHPSMYCLCFGISLKNGKNLLSLVKQTICNGFYDKRVLTLRGSQGNGFQEHVLKSIGIQCFPEHRPAGIKVCSEKPFAREKDKSSKKLTLSTGSTEYSSICFHI